MKCAAFAAFFLSATCHAQLIPNYYGAVGGDSTEWQDASLWHGGTTPTASTEAWMNTDDTMVVVDEYATINKLIVARKARNVYLNITNDATMDIGSLLFMVSSRRGLSRIRSD